MEVQHRCNVKILAFFFVVCSVLQVKKHMRVTPFQIKRAKGSRVKTCLRERSLASNEA